jgi:NADH-quinone oxidoreductase subunit L
LAGIFSTVYLYLINPAMPGRISAALGPVYTTLVNNYYFDKFNDWFFAGGSRRFGGLLSNVGDGKVIEGIVNGTASMVGWWAALLRQVQSGYIYHYAFTMIIGLFALLTWWVVR